MVYYKQSYKLVQRISKWDACVRGIARIVAREHLSVIFHTKFRLKHPRDMFLTSFYVGCVLLFTFITWESGSCDMEFIIKFWYEKKKRELHVSRHRCHVSRDAKWRH